MGCHYCGLGGNLEERLGDFHALQLGGRRRARESAVQTTTLSAMVYLDNSAGRLHDVLTRLGAQKNQQNLRQAWIAVLEPDPETPAVLLRSISQVLVLAATAEADIRALGDVAEDDADLLLGWVPGVGAGLGQAHLLEQTPNAVSQQVGLTHLQSLAFAARELHRWDPRPPLPESKRDEAARLLADLLETLHAADDLDPAARAMLIRHAAELQYALNLAWVVGTEGVEDALAGAVGTARFVMWKDPETGGKSSFKRFVETMSDLTTILVVGQTSLAIGTSVAGLLGS